MSALVDSMIGLCDTGSQGDTRTPLKALAWARVSTDMQEEKGLSIPEQLREIRAYAEKNGIEIMGEFHEAASAFQKKVRRVEFERMLELAKSSKDVSAILVHDLSRFSRDSLEAKLWIRDLTQAGVRVISLNDPYIDPESVAGVYMEAITFAKNEAYSREIAFHTKKGCRANVQTRDTETGWCYKNGGQPLWGYRSERFQRGEVKKGRPLVKSIWVPDDAIVAGKPVSEWARYCLVELAAKGASLDELRDFCNSHGIPAPRQQYWGSTTWNSLLHPHSLLQYAGYGVWNVRGKKQRWNPPSEWVIVENAHEALITEDEAKRIIEARKARHFNPSVKTSNRAMSSPYLLSGGLFICQRCGSNMMGYRRSGEGTYYVCGSQPYRKGMGCGPGVYVPQKNMEAEVVAGLRDLIGICADPKGFARQVNEQLQRLWEESVGYNPTGGERLEQIDAKLANIRRAIEDGLTDAAWANDRLRELLCEREEILSKPAVTGQSPQIDIETAMAYRRDLERVFECGTTVEQKAFLRAWVEKIQLAPEGLEVEINYRIPEPVVNRLGAGVGFEPTTFGL